MVTALYRIRLDGAISALSRRRALTLERQQNPTRFS